MWEGVVMSLFVSQRWKGGGWWGGIGKNRCFVKEGQSSSGIFHVGTAAQREQVSNRLQCKATEWLWGRKNKVIERLRLNPRRAEAQSAGVWSRAEGRAWEGGSLKCRKKRMMGEENIREEVKNLKEKREERKKRGWEREKERQLLLRCHSRPPSGVFRPLKSPPLFSAGR